VLSGVALPVDQIPLDVLQQHDLGRRIHDRQRSLEVQFLARQAECVLPVLYRDWLLVLPWGNRCGVGQLPLTLGISTDSIAAGRGSHTDAATCIILSAIRRGRPKRIAPDRSSALRSGVQALMPGSVTKMSAPFPD
jgi:hypothetical protein